ncbi:MAG TPA: FAD-dependent oxidoreductase [Blastocatellia bacterium]|nr:FAD-dependent oxidoreductase [Blastocatellia bacterium]
MSIDRREFVTALAAGALLPPAARRAQRKQTRMEAKTFDVAVIGAGVFGAWTAWHLQKSGKQVALLDAYGAAHSRASSGGESRVIRMGYGADEIYTRWSLRSLTLWQEFFAQVKQPLFHKTGMLWMAREQDAYTVATKATLKKCGVKFEELQRAELEKRWPQISFGPVTWALYEPDSGALLARRAVQAVVHDAVNRGVQYFTEAVSAPSGKGKIDSVQTSSGETISAGAFVFSCGPWLPKVFPTLLGERIHTTRQEIYFFGAKAGDNRWRPPAMPTWIDFGAEIYGIPDLENRGFKVALDRHGPTLDPDTNERIITPSLLAEVRKHLAERFPDLQDAPLIESRVCQYENTSNGDFLIDRHPEMSNVWLVGGGSGHGFKHGPALGEYVATRVVQGDAVEQRFTLATKEKVQKRSVF